ncbi:hypothetical protein, partial [Pseudoalteromonas sp. AC71-MNA-CIBAN-0107]|uniref:hypothetical protein n=1 Tax=Pseudoalteromonas sp. AC71-MNA-CIBAN-0107 TaxID=3140437 RepID=UPI00331B85D9
MSPCPDEDCVAPHHAATGDAAACTAFSKRHAVIGLRLRTASRSIRYRNYKRRVIRRSQDSARGRADAGTKRGTHDARKRHAGCTPA